MYCICCKKNSVFPLGQNSKLNQKLTEESLLWKKTKKVDGTISTINNEMVENGIINIIEAGYGSKNDGNRIIIAICDDCINTNLIDGTLLYFDNYMIKDDSSDLINRSKQAYRRRKNIDNLTND